MADASMAQFVGSITSQNFRLESSVNRAFLRVTKAKVHEIVQIIYFRGHAIPEASIAKRRNLKVDPVCHQRERPPFITSRSLLFHAIAQKSF